MFHSLKEPTLSSRLALLKLLVAILFAALLFPHLIPPELHGLMVTAAKAASNLHISSKASLVVSMREQNTIPYGIHRFLTITSIFLVS